MKNNTMAIPETQSAFLLAQQHELEEPSNEESDIVTIDQWIALPQLRQDKLDESCQDENIEANKGIVHRLLVLCQTICQKALCEACRALQKAEDRG